MEEGFGWTGDSRGGEGQIKHPCGHLKDTFIRHASPREKQRLKRTQGTAGRAAAASLRGVSYVEVWMKTFQIYGASKTQIKHLSKKQDGDVSNGVPLVRSGWCRGRRCYQRPRFLVVTSCRRATPERQPTAPGWCSGKTAEETKPPRTSTRRLTEEHTISWRTSSMRFCGGYMNYYNLTAVNSSFNNVSLENKV